MKQGSVQGHMEGWSFNDISLLNYIGICPRDIGGEIGFLRLVSIGGIPSFFLFIVLIISSIKNLNKKIKYNNPNLYPLFVGCMAYICTFSLSNFNLPMLFCFSTVGFFSVIVIISNCEISS